MRRRYMQTLFTDAVKQAQQRHGSRASYARMEGAGERENGQLDQQEIDFIQGRDGFYMASVGEDGWPYVQYRGGPPGFLRVLDGVTLAYADFRGNRQYISVGNLSADDRVSLFLMDYANRRRLKLIARAEVHEASERPDLVERVSDSDYEAVVERVMVYRLVGFDWNCPQHITPRFTEAELRAAGR